MRSFLTIILALCLSATASDVVGQEADTLKVESDTLKVKKLHSAVKASFMSAALPGLGQIYNGKWWKVPIIYGAFGGLIYSSVWNDSKCRTYRNAYLLRVDDDPATVDEFEGRYSDANLRELVTFYKRNRDISLIFTGVIYALNIIDASVDAHLKGFDVSDDLTLKVKPRLQQIENEPFPMAGLGLTFLLK